jgi:hypothetical protein
MLEAGRHTAIIITIIIIITNNSNNSKCNKGAGAEDNDQNFLLRVEFGCKLL